MKDKMFLTLNSVVKDIDDIEGTLTAYVSTAARDRMDEVLLPEGADLKHFKKNPVVLFGHKYDEPPIGKALWIKNDGDGLIAKVKFASTEFAQEIFTLFKEGIMSAFSVGFIPKQWVDGDGEKKARRTYEKWELLEFSAVAVPANPEALALAMSKGLIKSEALKKEFKIDPSAEPPAGDPPPAEPPAKDYLEDIKAMEAEIEHLEENKVAAIIEITALKKEVSDLRYKIYEILHRPEQSKIVPEISGDELAKIIGELVSGEIRRVTGKVN